MLSAEHQRCLGDPNCVQRATGFCARCYQQEGVQYQGLRQWVSAVFDLENSVVKG